MSSPPDFPELKAGEHAVLVDEIANGIVHGLGGGRYRGAGQRYFVAASLGEAEAFASDRVNRDPRMECVIYDHLGEAAAVVRAPDWERQFPPAPPREPWWKLW